MANEYRVTSYTIDVLDKGVSYGRLTALDLSALYADGAGARLTSHTIDVLVGPETHARATSFTLGSLITDVTPARFTSVTLDALRDYPAPVAQPNEVATLFSETLHTGHGQAEVLALLTETLRSTSEGPTQVRAAALFVEMLVSVALGGRKRAAQIIG